MKILRPRADVRTMETCLGLVLEDMRLMWCLYSGSRELDPLLGGLWLFAFT